MHKIMIAILTLLFLAGCWHVDIANQPDSDTWILPRASYPSPYSPMVEPEDEGLSYDELLAFLETDKTNEIPYVRQNPDYGYMKGDFVCHDFARTLYYNAKEADLNVGFVSVRFEDGVYHALNVFDTDEGLVFVDCSSGHDAIVNLAVGEHYSWTYFEYPKRQAPIKVCSVVGFAPVEEYRIAWDFEDWGDLWKD